MRNLSKFQRFDAHWWKRCGVRVARKLLRSGGEHVQGGIGLVQTGQAFGKLQLHSDLASKIRVERLKFHKPNRSELSYERVTQLFLTWIRSEQFSGPAHTRCNNSWSFEEKSDSVFLFDGALELLLRVTVHAHLKVALPKSGFPPPSSKGKLCGYSRYWQNIWQCWDTSWRWDFCTMA